MVLKETKRNLNKTTSQKPTLYSGEQAAMRASSRRPTHAPGSLLISYSILGCPYSVLRFQIKHLVRPRGGREAEPRYFSCTSYSVSSAQVSCLVLATIRKFRFPLFAFSAGCAEQWTVAGIEQFYPWGYIIPPPNNATRADAASVCHS